MKSRVLVAIGMVVADLGIFVGTSVFLPRRGSFGFSGPWNHFVNSRERWDIAWGVFVAALVLSLGVFLLLEGFGVFRKKGKNIEQDVRP